MKPWLEDILDQLTTARILAHADISCGERLAMIIVDNAVEYTCKAYVEAHKNLVPRVIKKQKWEETKQSFAGTLNFVASQESGLSSCVNTVLGFHDVRNRLYHEGQPLSVKKATVDDYLEQARAVLQILLGVAEDQSEQEKRTASLHRALLGEAAQEVKVGVEFERANDSVYFTTGVVVRLPDAICLVIHGFARQRGEAPTMDELVDALARSGHTTTPKIAATRASELRRNGILRRDSLSLTDKGRKRLLSKYLSLIPAPLDSAASRVLP